MKKLKEILLWFVSGLATAFFLVILLLKKNLNNITIKRQKIKNSDGSKIDISDIGKKEKRGLFKRLKNRKNGKN